MLINSTLIADSYLSQQYPQYLQQTSNEQPSSRQVNPWSLPQTQGNNPEYQQYQNYPGQSYQEDRKSDRQPDRLHQGFRFVTPEILESLKQQQMQQQLMPDDLRRQQRMQRQLSPGTYGYPSYGMGYSAPFYGLPGLSPWGGGTGLLYQGQSSPWVPNAAIGGLSPIPLPSYDGSDMSDMQDSYDVFNPYSLLPGAD